jgi:hypothetical protein
MAKRRSKKNVGAIETAPISEIDGAIQPEEQSQEQVTKILICAPLKLIATISQDMEGKGYAYEIVDALDVYAVNAAIDAGDFDYFISIESVLNLPDNFAELLIEKTNIIPDYLGAVVLNKGKFTTLVPNKNGMAEYVAIPGIAGILPKAKIKNRIAAGNTNIIGRLAGHSKAMVINNPQAPEIKKKKCCS